MLSDEGIMKWFHQLFTHWSQKILVPYTDENQNNSCWTNSDLILHFAYSLQHTFKVHQALSLSTQSSFLQICWTKTRYCKGGSKSLKLLFTWWDLYLSTNVAAKEGWKKRCSLVEWLLGIWLWAPYRPLSSSQLLAALDLQGWQTYWVQHLEAPLPGRKSKNDMTYVPNIEKCNLRICKIAKERKVDDWVC
jgi:hypothetical protein